MAESEATPSLFDDPQALEQEQKITAALSAINTTFGDGTVRLAVQGSGHIKTTCQKQSPHYTTRWTDLPKVSVK
jgi:hypothetical protein